jgi:hypothetical protein
MMFAHGAGRNRPFPEKDLKKKRRRSGRSGNSARGTFVRRSLGAIPPHIPPCANGMTPQGFDGPQNRFP